MCCEYILKDGYESIRLLRAVYYKSGAKFFCQSSVIADNLPACLTR